MSQEIKENQLIHCIYSSEETIPFSSYDIFSLLESARKVNLNLGVTGVLLYDSGSFFQVLEGEISIVDSLYKKISNDKRHHRMRKIIQEPIESREFAEWTMGYAGISRKELKNIDGLNDFFVGGACYTDLDEGRAKKLLKAFKDGRWRASIR
ncbi:BLUF domain-containing protein [Photobacterium sp. 1_MG-2023]|uniref:BLUF domain-containing protein n=1 Tax=Photobacterium sp. 1_MG-2023 TaxID=3062646 RepID=UPI0026E48761|nr:BLUF domain-containing protein [Photobacterium sp. 1_MG-2023]MDO6706772.1 BLUF domain-containing protein [Photobacterium sp. 1_MG-2023]